MLIKITFPHHFSTVVLWDRTTVLLIPFKDHYELYCIQYVFVIAWLRLQYMGCIFRVLLIAQARRASAISNEKNKFYIARATMRYLVYRMVNCERNNKITQ